MWTLFGTWLNQTQLKKQKKKNEENLNFELYVNNWDQNYYF